MGATRANSTAELPRRQVHPFGAPRRRKRRKSIASPSTGRAAR
ncbi:protein of unassigned function [Methylobacterium oryzae CBMB20]|uniref:Protein of unassigned function n=1 Tax=Methylobacterium oryzae CBMB20 TaxID=693986 RepID=A0A089NXH7_9HYPH|nr:protein of unassigned function [Methylobacterium oryzae CBMB20]